MPRTLNALLRDRRGVVGLTFTVSVTAAVLMMLAAMDLLRVSILRSRVQSALDSAVLAVGYNLGSAESEWKAEGQSYFAANMGENSMGSTLGTATFTSSLGTDGITRVIGSVTATVPLMISGFTDAGAMEISMSTKARKRTRANVEMVLALDNTGSMGGTKMTEAKAAAKKLVTTMLGSGTSGGNTYVGLVPFTETVRVGNTTQTQGWLEAGSTITGWNGCLFERADASGNYVVEKTAPGTKAFKPYFDIRMWEYEETKTSTYWDIWNWKWVTTTETVPCQQTDNNKKDCKKLSSPKVETMTSQNGCTDATVTFLTGNQTTLDTAVEAMSANGSTMVAAGAMWGWRMLSPEWRGVWVANSPLPKNAATDLNKVLVLLTDGDNAVSMNWYKDVGYVFRSPYGDASAAKPWGDLTGNNNKNADNLLWNNPESVGAITSYCTQAKADGIVIYTIPFGTSISSNTETILRGCATDEEKYFRVTAATDLTNTFKTITDTLSELVIEE